MTLTKAGMIKYLRLAIPIAIVSVLLLVGIPVYAQTSAVVTYPPEAKTDYDKLVAVYSLLEQMRLEHNRVGDIAESDWKQYQAQWYEYAKIFKAKQLVLLQEQNRLRDAIRKANYTDIEWMKLTETERDLAFAAMYGSKDSLKILSTRATTPVLTQLKAIDFYSLKGQFIDPTEDFTTYSETDSAGDITITDANTITVTTMARTAVSWVVSDKGAGHFGDFTHLISVITIATSADTAAGGWWALTNTPGTEQDFDDANSGVRMGFWRNSTADRRHTVTDYSNNNNDYHATNGSNPDFYQTIARSGTTLTVELYEDAARTTLHDTLSITCANTTYRYIEAVHSRDATGTATISFVVEDLDLQEAGVVAPTVTTQAASSVEATTATGNGDITNTGGEDAGTRGFEWDTNSGAPYANDVHEHGSFGTGAYTLSLTGLPTGTTIYYRAYATNSAGTGYGGEVTFLTKPAAPTNISATDGTHTDKVVVTWTKSTGATGYKVYEGVNLLDTLGDVATYDDNAAPAPTITAGTASASDGTSTAQIVLSIAGESANNGASRTYKLKALNATGDSVDSSTDTGYRGVGVLGYQWYKSNADADAAYGAIGGATTDPYNDAAAPQGSITPGAATASDGTSGTIVTVSVGGESTTNGAGRWYYCTLSATGAANQDTNHNRGYRGVGAITYQWQKSANDADADYANITGATTDPYDDTGAPVDGSGRYYKAVLSASGAVNQTTTADRGFITPGVIPPTGTSYGIISYGLVVGAIIGFVIRRRKRRQAYA